jgi:L-lysine 2,3-aminomutase
MLDQQVQNAANRSEFARMNMNFYKQEYTALANLAESERSATWEEDIKRAKQAYMESAAAWQSETEAAVQAVQDKYINAIDKIFVEFESFEDFDDAINGMVATDDAGVKTFQSGWGDILAEDEKYLDAIESAYEKNAITMKYNLALNNASASA